jgi:hypothetical protein
MYASLVDEIDVWVKVMLYLGVFVFFISKIVP